MKIIIYFAVTRYNERIYMTEKENEKSCLVDLIDDCTDLQNELDWRELDEIHRAISTTMWCGL